METLQNNSQKSIGQFVADDYRTAAIFSKHKIIMRLEDIKNELVEIKNQL